MWTAREEAIDLLAMIYNPDSELPIMLAFQGDRSYHRVIFYQDGIEFTTA